MASQALPQQKLLETRDRYIEVISQDNIIWSAPYTFATTKYLLTKLNEKIIVFQDSQEIGAYPNKELENSTRETIEEILCEFSYRNIYLHFDHTTSKYGIVKNKN